MAETMQAGRELDALVAERVLCATWNRHEEATADWLAFDHDGPHGNPCVSSWVLASRDRDGDVEVWWNCPNYSTDIAPAWQVVEKMLEQGYRVRIEERRSGAYCDVIGGDSGQDSARENSAPLAICIASLRAVESAKESMPAVSRVDADSKEKA